MSTFPGVFSKSEISHCWGSSQCVWAAESQHFLWDSTARSYCTPSPEPSTHPWYKSYSAPSAQTLPSQHRQTGANLCCGQQKWLRSSFSCRWMERRTVGLPAQPPCECKSRNRQATALKVPQHRLSPEALQGQQQQQDSSVWHWIPSQGMHNILWSTQKSWLHLFLK